jgi:hypothetical protein
VNVAFEVAYLCELCQRIVLRAQVLGQPKNFLPNLYRYQRHPSSRQIGALFECRGACRVLCTQAGTPEPTMFSCFRKKA